MATAAHMIGRGRSLEEQLSKFPPELLDRRCFDSHLGKLVHHITTDAMVMMATDLGLSDIEVEDCQFSWIRNPAKQRLEMFKKWQEKKSSEATYRYRMYVAMYGYFWIYARLPVSDSNCCECLVAMMQGGKEGHIILITDCF
jgi:hypothetical protein